MKLRYLLIALTIWTASSSIAYTQSLPEQLDSCKRTVVKYYYQTQQQQKEIDSLKLDKRMLNQAVTYQNRAYDILEQENDVLQKSVKKEKTRKILGVSLGVAGGLLGGILIGFLAK